MCHCLREIDRPLDLWSLWMRRVGELSSLLSLSEISTFHTGNILSVNTVVQPSDVIVLDDYSVYAPHVYHGDLNDNHYLTIHRHTICYIRYADLFAAGNPKGILPSKYDTTQSSALAGPSRHAPQRSNAKSAHPCTYITYFS